MCKYEFEDKSKCKEEPFEDSEYCILHMKGPEVGSTEDRRSEEYKRINGLKNAKVKEKVSKGDFNFDGARLYFVYINNVETVTNLEFEKAVINCGDDIDCIKRLYNYTLNYRNNTLYFSDAVIDGNISINNSNIGGELLCGNTKINGSVIINNTNINGFVAFNYSEIGGGIDIIHESSIVGVFYLDEAKIGGYFNLYRSEIKGKLSCKSTKFDKPSAQEEACRIAKIKCEESGYRTGADEYFYREMEAKRKQKGKILRFLELPIQYVFGYGTKWERVLFSWVLVVLICTFIFWFGNGILENGIKEVTSFWTNLYFSIVTITTLGYGDFQPKPGLFRLVASIGAVFGTFMWAAFIVIFARKFMR